MSVATSHLGASGPGIATSRAASVPAPAARAAATPRRRAARVYLVLAALLAPLCVPAGPGQTAALDLVNLFAIAAFVLLVVGPGRAPLRAPLLAPIAFVAVGSLIACAWAPSLSLAALALAQDAYLYAWFLVVVNLVRTRHDLRAVRVAWVWAAVAVSLGAVGQLLLHTGGSLGTLLGSKGMRPAATLYNPNMLADYLVMSLFTALSLGAEMRRLPLAFAVATIGLGLLATKSNGGMIAFAVGALVWCVVAVATGPSRRHRGFLAAAAILASLAGLGAWLNAEWGVGDGVLHALKEHTFAGRMEHSGESRLRIWDQLERTYARSPLGIGPGNSGSLTLGIAERERPDSYRSKEAHSDYLAFAIERGPLGLLGLAGLTLAGFLAVARYWQRMRRDRDATPRRAGLWTASMAAALAASAMHSTVIEKLHFRHFWLFLALVCASAFVVPERAPAPVAEAA
jgi:hypothetical protein